MYYVVAEQDGDAQSRLLDGFLLYRVAQGNLFVEINHRAHLGRHFAKRLADVVRVVVGACEILAYLHAFLFECHAVEQVVHTVFNRCVGIFILRLLCRVVTAGSDDKVHCHDEKRI